MVWSCSIRRCSASLGPLLPLAPMVEAREGYRFIELVAEKDEIKNIH